MDALQDKSIAQESEIEGFTATIAHALQPRRIVMFGSRARGEARADSDVDLLVIVGNGVDPSWAGREGYRALGMHKTPVDLIVLTEAEFAGRSQLPWTVAAAAAREGIVVYECAA